VETLFLLGRCRNVTMTKANAAIMMEKSALDEISKILVSNKRTANDGNEKSAPKRRCNNTTCNTTHHGVTGFDALHGVADVGTVTIK
jgi:hypothetical protein